MTLSEMAVEYEKLLAEKAELEKAAEANKAAIASFKEKLMQQMVDEDMPSFTSNGHSYSIAEKVSYSKKSDADLAAAGLDFFATLREEGLGSLIKETVAAQTLQAAMKNYAEEHGGLSEGLDAVIRSYPYTDISRTSSKKKTPKGAKK